MPRSGLEGCLALTFKYPKTNKKGRKKTISIRSNHVHTILFRICSKVTNFLKRYTLYKKKRNVLFAILGGEIIDFKNCFNSMDLPSNKDLDGIVSS